MFFRAAAQVQWLGLKAAKMCDFVFASGYTAKGDRVEAVPTHERDSDNEGVNTAAVFRARKAAQKAGPKCKYWFVSYKTMRELGEVRTVAEADSDTKHPWLVIEGWERGKNCGAAFGQAFRRKTRTLPFKPLAPMEELGFIPVNVFNGSPTLLPRYAREMAEAFK